MIAEGTPEDVVLELLSFAGLFLMPLLNGKTRPAPEPRPHREGAALRQQAPLNDCRDFSGAYLIVFSGPGKKAVKFDHFALTNQSRPFLLEI